MAQLDRAPITGFKTPRFRLCWSSKSVPEANWHLLGLIGFYHKETPRRWWIVLSARSVLGWSASAAVAGYFLGTAALAYIWSRNPYNRISYADLVLPTRWTEVKHLRGLGLIDEGLAELRARKYPSAILLLTKGVTYAPEEPRGRFALASIYVQIGYVHRGLQLLEEGLEYDRPTKLHRELMFRVATYLEDYETLLTLADRTEKTLPADDASARRWVLTQKIAALEKLKRYDALDALREQYRASPFFALETAWARSQAARGSPQQALAELRTDPTRFGLAEDRYKIEIALNQALGDYEGAVQAARAWRQAEPASPLPRIEEVFVHIKAGRNTAASEALEEYFLYFSNQAPALLLAFKRLGELPDPRWLRFARQETASTSAGRLDLNILYVQGLLTMGQLGEAHAEFLRTKNAIAAAKVADGGWTEGTHFLTQLLLGDSPSNRAQLLGYCTTRRLGPEAFRFMIKSIRVAGLNDVADEVAAIATNRFPAFKDDVRPVNVAETSRANPERFTLRVAEGAEIKNLTGARLELRRLREEIAQRNWTNARPLLRRIEQAGFKEIENELRLCRIEIQGYSREQSELTGTLQLYLRAREVDQATLRRLATAWDNPEFKDSALTLCRLTTERFPQAKWAQDLRKKLEGELEVAPIADVEPKA